MFQPLPRNEPEPLEDVFDDVVPTQRRPQAVGRGRTLIPPPRRTGEDEGRVDIRAILSEPPRLSLEPLDSRPSFSGVEIQHEEDWQGDRTPPPLASDLGSIAPMAVSDTLPPGAPRAPAPRASWMAAGAIGAMAALAGFVLFSQLDGPASQATQAFAVPAAAQAPPVVAVEDLPIVGVVEPQTGEEEDTTIEWVTVLNEVVVWSDRESTSPDRPERERGDASEELVLPSSEPPSREEQSELVVASEPSRAGPFDRFAASAALEASAAAAMSCRRPETPPGAARVSVTFAPSGRVTTATVMGAFAGTPEGGCIARTFRAARVEPFEGGLVTVHKTVAVR
ncbi:MAG: hypothetical protein CVU63_00085 [Deltaproteobacteria bacterium HGW-Deltaproteobacteria-20]|nr:MAG: hypothetical protein CVU63_00085 [Deltaproteobacteria bacterium HGW-Deltaproteobacteria-20]